MNTQPELSAEKLNAMIQARMQPYSEMELLEHFAIFMGKAQILEFALKNLLTRKFAVPPAELERSTLGMLKDKLAAQGVRTDYIAHLSKLVRQRNHIAHEFLANHALLNSLAEFSPLNSMGTLFWACYELERLIILHDWLEEHDAWKYVEREVARSEPHPEDSLAIDAHTASSSLASNDPESSGA